MGVAATVSAVDGVSLEVQRGESLGIVGMSGSGKSTLVRLLLVLDRPDRGVVCFQGHPISRWPEHRIRPLRRSFQAVFQDPTLSLDPCLDVATIISEPLVAHGIGSAADRLARVRSLLELVGLDPGGAHLPAAAFSGGERQRIAIARALAPSPELVLLDEPVSSLDRPVQTQILDLIGELRARRRLTLVLVSHDLAVIRASCDRLLVMDHGRVVEEGPTPQIFETPAHPSTRELLAAALSRVRISAR
jgi:peptide/nickel transport system ATP-binding protein